MADNGVIKKRRIDTYGGEKALPVEGSGENNIGSKGGVGKENELDDMMDWLPLDDDKLSELSELLESMSETSTLPPFDYKVKFVDNPYISPVIVQSSSGYITINGNEESCGPSFSDLEASVMASFDRCSLSRTVGGGCEELDGGACSSDDLKTRGLVEEGIEDLEHFSMGEIDGWDSVESVAENVTDDDDMWERFLAEELGGSSSKLKL